MRDKIVEAQSSEYATYLEYSRVPMVDPGLIGGHSRKQKVFVLKDGNIYKHGRLVFDSAGGHTYRKPNQ